MLTPDAELATKFRQMIVETTRMLITVGFDQNITEFKQSIKLQFIFLLDSPMIRDSGVLSNYKRACAERSLFTLRVELLEIFVKHESCKLEMHILIAAAEIMCVREKIIFPPGIILDPFNEMFDSLAEMFQCLVMGQFNEMVNRMEGKMRSNNRSKKTFIEAFIIIAGFSLRPGCSNKLLRAIISVLNANMVKRLKCGLSKRIQVMRPSTPDKLRSFANAALKYVEEIQIPFSMQNLSRFAINRGLSMGSQNIESLTSNKLPVHLKAYVLHQD